MLAVVVVVVGSALSGDVLDADVGESVLLPCGVLDNSKFNLISFLLNPK